MSHPLRPLRILLIAGSIVSSVHAAPPTYVGSSQDFTVAKSTEIPGGTLKPGEYSIHILDQLSDRMIVRVDKSDGKQHAIFLGVPHAAYADASGTGPAEWKTGAQGSQALRGFEFSNGSTVEFVYPKDEAVAIATKNAANVVAVDPDSEGRPKLTKMSHDDMQVVTLWTLSLTTETPNSKTPAIAAQRYTGRENGDATVVAKSSPAPASNAAPYSVPETRQEVATLETPTRVPAKVQAIHRHIVSQLPHTASELPVIFLMGLLSLFGATVIQIRRISLGSKK